MRQQLTIYERNQKHPRLRIGDRAFFAVAYVFVIMEVGSRRIDRWLHEVVGIEGLPIPYGAQNASPHIERFMRTLRVDALDHFMFLSVDHVRRVVSEYIRYYSGARPSQAIHGIPDPYPELKQPPPKTGRPVARPVLGGVQHDYRLAA